MPLFQVEEIQKLSLLLEAFFTRKSLKDFSIDGKILLSIPEPLKERVIQKCLNEGLVTQKELDYSNAQYYIDWSRLSETQIAEKFDLYFLYKNKWGIQMFLVDLIQNGYLMIFESLLCGRLHFGIDLPGGVTTPGRSYANVASGEFPVSCSLLQKLVLAHDLDRNNILRLVKILIEEKNCPLKEIVWSHVGEFEIDIEDSIQRLPKEDIVRQYIETGISPS